MRRACAADRLHRGESSLPNTGKTCYTIPTRKRREAGVKAGKTAKQSFFYKDLNVGIHTLPDVNHMLACATVIVKALGSDFCLSPVQNKDSAMIRPSIS